MLRAAGAAIALVVVVGIIAGSHVRVTAYAPADAVVRLAWSGRPERVESCRRVPAEELARLPVHMRREQVCEGSAARYELTMERDGVALVTAVLRGGGIRRDRQIYVYREVPLAPGTARITVRLTRLDSTSAVDDSARGGERVEEDETTRRRRAVAIPPHLSLDTVIALGSRSVLLVTYHAALRRLVARTADP